MYKRPSTCWEQPVPSLTLVFVFGGLHVAAPFLFQVNVARWHWRWLRIHGRMSPLPLSVHTWTQVSLAVEITTGRPQAPARVKHNAV